MKKVILSLGLLFTVTLATQAKPVSQQQARTAGTHFISNYLSGRNNPTLELARTYYDETSQLPVFYIFNAAGNKGFVIVAADDKSTPVLGYSTESAFPATELSPELSYWLDGYKKQISYAIAHQRVPLPSITQKWQDLALEAEGPVAARPTGVAPMLETNWNQAPYYNQLCPTNTPSGCVATAMAQIMKFWDNPTTGTGSHSYSSSTLGGTLSANFGATTYDWTNMPNVLTSGSSATQKTAIATLMFHCGVAVEMDYNTGGSGAQVIDMGIGWPCAENALKNNFGYKTSITGYKRNDFSDTQWHKMLKFEIDNGRPLLYVGFGDVGGHAFDFDGYDDNDFFHINWGWGGLSNGYFIVDDLSPSALGIGGGGGNFNYGQQALVMIQPAGSILPDNPVTPDFPNPFENINLALNGAISVSADTIIYNTPYSVGVDVINLGPDTFKEGVLAVLAIEMEGDEGYLLNGVVLTIDPTDIFNLAYTTTGSEDLVPGSYYIGFCYAPSMDELNFLPIPDGLGTNEVILTVLPGASGIANRSEEHNFISYPNPAKDFFTLNWKSFTGNVQRVTLVNIAGQTVYNQDVQQATQCRIPVAQYAAGTYILQIHTDKGVIAKKMNIGK